MKLKIYNLLKPLCTIIQQNFLSFYPSELIYFAFFNMRHPVSYIHDIDEVRSLQIATAKRALKTDLETAKLNLQKGIDSKAPKVDVENLKVRCPRITVLYSNAGHKTILGPFGPRMVLCPSGFLTFAFPKTCAPIRIFSFKITYGGGQLPKNVCKIL